ncbi:hypothetical protein LCGC14_0940010 [marine sediment metagenome]|uniref:Beta-1,4-mannosyl-glycoprotein beta-1,4-N-acetylglucosaminyltransferase n=1 Tax=marine sediment metagenome TaxID=412755 RepID=A0A0F9RRP9_9ZZZZ
MIIDCFAFFNELDVLEIRLRELAPVVDCFVLSEATRTFSGKEKPLYYDENKERFAEFAHKIHHVVIYDYEGIDVKDTWSMDWGQKQRGVDAMLRHCRPADDDLILLSDCDEIPRAIEVRLFADNPNGRLAVPLMLIFYYWLNCRQMGPFERCAKWLTRGLLRRLGDDLRKVRTSRAGWEIVLGGWHFSYLTDVATKIQSWAHSEYNTPAIRDPAHIERCRQEGLDLFGRDFRYEFLDDLSYLPECIGQYPERFGHLIHHESESNET